MSAPKPASRDDFSIAIFCALGLEADAIHGVLDKIWEDEGQQWGKAEGDLNSYRTGVLGCHNVVVVYLAGMGLLDATTAAVNLSKSFTKISLALVAGICGGVPEPEQYQRPIFLGDVVISTGIIQHDFGRLHETGFKRKASLEDSLSRPPTSVRTFLSTLKTEHYRNRLRDDIASSLLTLTDKDKVARYPRPDEDHMYEATYLHKHRRGKESFCEPCASSALNYCSTACESTCDTLGCEEAFRVSRTAREAITGSHLQKANVHFGRFGCGNAVIKAASSRDTIASMDHLLAFEMEGAGIWAQLPCLIVKGVSDYADSHKVKTWQSFAANTAAAAVKSITTIWAPATSIYGAKAPQAMSDPSRSPMILPAQLRISRQVSNQHWMVDRPLNALFTGRERLLVRLENILREHSSTKRPVGPCRIVITGMGGQGKSELCLRLAESLRTSLWGVFCIDVSTKAQAEMGYLRIARKISGSCATFDQAKSIVAGTERPWLLILDNADDPDIDYQEYIPANIRGCVLLNSRNPECGAHATACHETLRELLPDEARSLLLKATRTCESQWRSLESKADEICALLGRHPLALLQAGAYISHRYCTLAQYPDVFKQHHERLLTYQPRQAQSRYTSVYATFDAAFAVLDRDASEESRDAQELLSTISMLSPSPIHMSLWTSAWYAASCITKTTPSSYDTCDLSEWHVHNYISCGSAFDRSSEYYSPRESSDDSRFLKVIDNITTNYLRPLLSAIIPLVKAETKPPYSALESKRLGDEPLAYVAGRPMSSDQSFDNFRLLCAIRYLRALGLVMDHSCDETAISVHPLVLTWVRSRQTSQIRTQSWMRACCFLALISTSVDHEDLETWHLLQHHVMSFLGHESSDVMRELPPKEVARAMYQLAMLLVTWNSYEALLSLVQTILDRLRIVPSITFLSKIPWLDLQAFVLSKLGKQEASISIQREVVQMLEAVYGPQSEELLLPLCNLGAALHGLDEVRRIQDRTAAMLVRMDMISDLKGDWIDFQKARAHLWSGATRTAITLLHHLSEEVSSTHGRDSIQYLWCRAELSRAHAAEGNLEVAIAITRAVATTVRQKLPETHRARRYAEYQEVSLLWKLGDRKQAFEAMERLTRLSHRVNRSKKYEIQLETMREALEMGSLGQHAKSIFSIDATTVAGPDHMSRGRWNAALNNTARLASETEESQSTTSQGPFDTMIVEGLEDYERFRVMEEPS